MKLRLASASVGMLLKAVDQPTFEFYGKTLMNRPQQRASRKRGIALVNGTMGGVGGEVCVRRHYPPESEAKIGELIANLRAAYKEQIGANSWVDQTIKTQALAKFAAFDPRIGHSVKMYRLYLAPARARRPA